MFEEVGARVAKMWCRSRYASDALPTIAAEELDRNPLYRTTDNTAIVKWLTTTDTLPFQPNLDTAFGEPPLTLFWHPKFYIEALFWHSATTAIHGHGFSGAFQVLTGNSVQSLFEFESPSTDMKCRVGRLNQRCVEILRPGATQTIGSGERFVHSVFHLGYPSVTIVIRTHGGGAAQHRYYRPGVAVLKDIKHDQLTTRLLQIANLQATLRAPDLQDTVKRIGEQCELAASFRLLQILHSILIKQGRLDTLASVIVTLGESHGLQTISRLAESITFESRLHPVMQARDSIVDEELRFFLALLLTQQRRPFIMSQTASFAKTDQPSSRVAQWIGDLAAKGVLNVPADKVTTHVVKTWLERGREVACKTAHLAGDPDTIAHRVRDLMAEPLLGSLLQDHPLDEPRG